MTALIYPLSCLMRRSFLSLVFCMVLTPSLAWSWWNDEWKSRKQITIDASITGGDIKENLADFPLLVRLHAGNFSYFSELAEDGKDLRFMADDKTPLKYQIEKYDAINEMALIWLRVPKITGGATSDSFLMYYGNDKAPASDGSSGVFDNDTALVFHFDSNHAVPQDATANNNHANASTATPEPAGWIGGAAKFSGNSSVSVTAQPSLGFSPAKGWTFTAWLKADQPQPQAEGHVFKAADNLTSLELLVRGSTLLIRYTSEGKAVETPAVPLNKPGQWQHVGVVLRNDKLELFIDGKNTVELPLKPMTMTPAVTLGSDGTGSFLQGYLDEVQISTVARSVDWLSLSARSQSPDFIVVNMGGDEGNESGSESSFGVIIQNVTIDGWVVIGLTGIMFVVAVIVMIIKAVVLTRVRKDNRAFLAAYASLSAESDIAALDREESEEDKELEDSDFLAAIAGSHDHYQSSPLYHIYHTGIREMNKRVGATNKPLTAEAMRVIQSALDAIIVRETQRLNGKMVLLSIAIAGGPYLGLLGTVVGVMITFAVIASTGDVNINTIAPGIAAALLATVAGLAVAIPALFAYNYLTVQIKDVIADMRVFSDEFLSMIAEKAADRLRTD